MKIWKFIGLVVVSLFFIGIIFYFEIKEWPAGSSIAGILLGFSLLALWHSFQDLFDTTDWKTSQRKLKRGGLISEDTIIRISFAYLYRIMVGDKYLLVKNERGAGKFQPVGGVYKLKGNEKTELKNLYHVIYDNKIPIDKSSLDDYRLQLQNKYLRNFVRRFNKKADREKIDNLSREFKEELVNKEIVNWNQIEYRYCGRHMTELKFGDHFQVYELLLADVVELMPTMEQEEELNQLMKRNSDTYRFATVEEIKSLGINTSTGNLVESIGDHTIKILQETEERLIKVLGVGKSYKVRL